MADLNRPDNAPDSWRQRPLPPANPTCREAYRPLRADRRQTEVNTLPRPLSAAVPIPYLLLALGLDQLQHSEFLLRDIGQRDREPDTLRVEDSEAPPHQTAVRRVHRLFEQVLRTAGAMAYVYGLPIRPARGAAIQLRLRGVTASAAAEDAVGTLFVRPAQPALVQDRPDQEANARLFRPVAGRGYSGSSSASMASCAMTSDTAADL